MSCPSESDPNREFKTWTYSSTRCPGNSPNLSDCPLGFQQKIGPKEDSTYRPDGCGQVFDVGNRAKCYKNVSSLTNDDMAKCCSFGDQYSCPPDICPNAPKCVSILSDYCSKNNNNTDNTKDNIQTTVCRVLKKGSVDTYNQILNDYCVGEKLNSHACKDYCKENLGSCSDNLKKFCKDKVGNATYNDICACFYDPQIYLDISTKLAKDWNFPEELGDPKPQCIYNKCKQADIVPDPTLCGAISIASCIQNIDIDATGAIIGNVNVIETAECKSTFKRKNNNPDNNSSSGSDNTPNTPKPSQSVKPDSDKPDSDKPGMSGLKIGLIVSGSLMLLVLIILIGVIIYNY